MKLEFVGDLKKGVRKYSGDGLNCWLEYPDTCLVDVSVEKGRQLLGDFPNQWKLSEGLEKLRVILQKPLKQIRLTKDNLNDEASKYFPDLKIDSYMLKKDIVALLLKRILEG